jgi:MFS family permease
VLIARGCDRDRVLATSPRPAGRIRSLHPAWIVAAVTFVTLLGAAGFRSAPGVLIVPLHDELGWSRATVSLAVAVNLVLFGLAGPFAAALMARYGLRRVVLTALATVAGAAAATTLMTAPWQFVVLWGGAVGAGTGCMATVLAATVASRWFVARRGLVTGALTAATATGQLAFLPALGWLAENVGWRWVSVVTAAGALAVIPLVARALHDGPEDLGTTPYGAPPDHTPPVRADRPVAVAFDGLRLAASTPAFWLLALSFFVCGASTNGLIGTHFIAAAVDNDLSETSASTLLALVGVFDVAGTLASGWLTDRIDPRRLLLAYYGLRGLALLVLHHVLDARGLGLAGFVVLYGLDWVATVPPTVALCNELFPAERAGVVYGWVFAAHQLGAAGAAYGAGVVHGSTGSYELAFHVAGALCIVTAGLVLLIRQGGHGDHDAHRDQESDSSRSPSASVSWRLAE